jgi:hypothetical protein
VGWPIDRPSYLKEISPKTHGKYCVSVFEEVQKLILYNLHNDSQEKNNFTSTSVHQYGVEDAGYKFK